MTFGGFSQLFFDRDTMPIDLVSDVFLVGVVLAYAMAYPMLCSFVPPTVPRAIVHTMAAALVAFTAAIQWVIALVMPCSYVDGTFARDHQTELDTSAQPRRHRAMHYTIVASVTIVTTIALMAYANCVAAAEERRFIETMRARRAASASAGRSTRPSSSTTDVDMDDMAASSTTTVESDDDDDEIAGE